MSRVTLSSLLQTVLLIAAYFALAAGDRWPGFRLLGEQLSHAAWWLVVADALLVQVTRPTNAISLTSASPEPTPPGPV